MSETQHNQVNQVSYKKLNKITQNKFILESNHNQLLCSISGPKQQSASQSQQMLKVKIDIQGIKQSNLTSKLQIITCLTKIIQNQIQTQLYEYKQIDIKVQVIKQNGLLVDCIYSVIQFGLVSLGVQMKDFGNLTITVYHSNQAVIVDPEQQQLKNAVSVMLLGVYKNQKQLIYFKQLDLSENVSFLDFYTVSVNYANQLIKLEFENFQKQIEQQDQELEN